jgi:hypothetical protein
VFRRRTSTDSTDETPEQTLARIEAEAAVERGKGRPTPSRREAEAARKARLKPTGDRKAMARRKRQQRMDQREKVRQAMVTGDQKNLPARDRGPVRAFCRDLVDSRFNVAEFLLPLLVLILVLSMIPSLIGVQFVLWMVTIVATTADTVWLWVRTRRELRARFPAGETRGAMAYTLLRSSQLRRLRLPKPRVKRGEALPAPRLH